MKIINEKLLLTLTIIYNIATLFWCYLIVKSFVFSLCIMEVGDGSVGIIGGADGPTLMFMFGGTLGIALVIMFAFLSIATVFLLTVSIFKKQKNQKFNRLLCIFSVLTLIIFVFIPAQTYNIALYSLASKIPLLKYSKIFYIIISVVNIIFLILPKSITTFAKINSELHN